jgi:aldehyde dehydrogenase (NAD+)
MTDALNFIDGKWTWLEVSDKFKSVNPANHKDTVCVYQNSSATEVARAVKAAREAYPEWRRTPAPERAKIIAEAGRIMAARKQELGELVTRECGKPIAEGLGDVQEAIDMAELAAGEGRRLLGFNAPSELPNKMCWAERRPIGVCGLITPWNFPIAIPAWKALHALVCGNTVVLKPAEDTPLCGCEFVRALDDAGIPRGVINLVHGDGETGKHLVLNPNVDMISFTGSTKTGREVAKSCADGSKNVSLECGGKNAQIVMDDANLDLAVEGALWGAFGTAGQRCTATSRLFLHHDIHDEVLSRLVSEAKKLKLGEGLDPETQVGPIINQQQIAHVLDHINFGISDNWAKLECGGKRATEFENGWFVEPTIFSGVRPECTPLFRNEIFGPVLSVTKFERLNDAINLLNDCAYGLSSSIYTQDINKAMHALREIEAGICYINGPTIGAEVHMPFGGIKATGNGHREASSTGIDTFTEWMTVYLDYSGKLQRAQIDN